MPLGVIVRLWRQSFISTVRSLNSVFSVYEVGWCDYLLLLSQIHPIMSPVLFCRYGSLERGSFILFSPLHYFMIIPHWFHIPCVVRANVVANILDFITLLWMIYSLEDRSILESLKSITAMSFGRCFLSFLSSFT